jgi:hypothetical protein
MPAINLIEYANRVTAPMRRGLVQKITNESVFLRILRFVPCDPLLGYRYNRRDTLGGIAFRGLNESYTADTGVINPQVEMPAIMGGEVDTDRQIIATPRGQDVRADNIAAKVKKTGLFYDKYCVDGDPATNPKQFYGLNARLTGNQVISAGTNGATLTLSMVDDAIDRVVGTTASEKRIVCNKFVRRKITSLVVAAAGGAAVLDVGKQLTEYNGVPIEVLDEDGDEAAILGFDETQGSSNVCSSLYVVRPGSDIEGEYLQGLVGSSMIEHEDQGVRGTTYIDLIEAALGIAMFHPRAACRVKGITAT